MILERGAGPAVSRTGAEARHSDELDSTQHTEILTRKETAKRLDRQELLDQLADIPEGWPKLGEAALYGLAGEIVGTVNRHTEADPVAILVDFLAAFGNAVGSGPHLLADSAEHPGRLFVLIVGATSRSRKGTSRAMVRRIMDLADPEWSEHCIAGGLSSGEGIISHLDRTKERRLFVHESEFARPLAAANRDKSTLSPVLRSCWDGVPLGILTRADPIRVDRAHVSVVAHITRDELLARFRSQEAANGFGNRFLFTLARRSKLLPNGRGVPGDIVTRLAGDATKRLEQARRVERMERTEAGAALWGLIYMQIPDDRRGLIDAVTARAEAQMARLSVIYALLDGSPTIDTAHIEAARAVWAYCDQSARLLFGGSTGHEAADRILDALKDAGGAGLSRTEIRDLFSRHRPNEISRTLRQLEEAGNVESYREESTGGRPAERFRLAETKATEATKGEPKPAWVASNASVAGGEA